MRDWLFWIISVLVLSIPVVMIVQKEISESHRQQDGLKPARIQSKPADFTGMNKEQEHVWHSGGIMDSVRDVLTP